MALNLAFWQSQVYFQTNPQALNNSKLEMSKKAGVIGFTFAWRSI